MKTRFLFILLFIVVFQIDSYGQNSFIEEYERFRSEAFAQYEDFRSKCNLEYAQMLKHSWEWFQTMPALEKPKEDKEIGPVVFEGDKEQGHKDNQIVIDNVISAPEPQPQPHPVSPIKPQPAALETMETTFFGTVLTVSVPNEKLLVENCTPENLSASWVAFSDGRFDTLAGECLRYREKLSLCDWAYLLMLFQVADSYYGEENVNSTVFLTAYVYCQSGYEMKLATTEKDGLVMLFSSKHKIYNAPFFIVGDTSYYAIGNLDETRLRICDADFNGSEPLSLEIPNALELTYFPTETITRRGEFKSVSIGVTTNRNILDFYETYPTSKLGDNFVSRWAMYANKPLDNTTQSLLYTQLKSILTGADEETTVDILLNFVQTGFAYEYDDKVWGQDRAFFPEETLYYPYCDCEDRSIFFSRLVRDLVGLDVILVYYPGHLATAVHFNSDMKGDFILLNGKKYVVCDPTYIGARIGWTMPDMDNRSASVILLSK